MPEVKQARELLSYNLKRLRTLRGLSQLALANELGVAANFINAIEREQKWVSPETLGKLSSFFNVEVYELFIPETDSYDQSNYRVAALINELEEFQSSILKEIRGKYLGSKQQNGDSRNEK